MRKKLTNKITMLVISLLVVVICSMPIAARTTSSVSKPGTFPIVKDKITLSVICPASTDPTQKMETNYFTKLMEERTNIHIEWRILNRASFKEQLSLVLASGDLPDMVWAGVGVAEQMTRVEESQYGAQGLFLPLNKIIDKQAYWFKEALKNEKILSKLMPTPDGTIYGLPNIAVELHTQYPYKMWINTTWLDNLGLKMPTTTEEFYQTLVAFRDKDPNRNGKKDEIPLSTNYKQGAGLELDGFLMNAFTYASDPKNDSRLYLKKGKITPSYMQPDYKEGLKYLNKLYKEGLIYKDSFTQDQRTQINLNEMGSEPVIGCYLGLLNGYACDVSVNNVSFKWHQYKTLPPLKGPKGFKTATFKPYSPYLCNLTFITRACKNPEAAFRMLDYMYSREGTLQCYYGREGKEWRVPEKGTTGLSGKPATWEQLAVDRKLPENQNIAWSQAVGLYRSAEFVDGQYFPTDIYDKKINPMVARMRLVYSGSLDMKKIAPKADIAMPPMAYPKETIGEMSQLTTTLNDYVNESVVKFITGALDPEKDWDAFQAQLKKLGLQRYLQIIQENYDKNYK